MKLVKNTKKRVDGGEKKNPGFFFFFRVKDTR